MEPDVQALLSGTATPEMEEDAIKNIPVDEDLAEYVYLLGVDLIEQGGIKPLQKAVEQSADPIAAIAQFVVQLMAELVEVLSQETNFDPRVMLGRDGFVDSISVYIERKLNLGEGAAVAIQEAVLEAVKGLAQGEKKPSPEQPGAALERMAGGAPMGAAPAPQGGLGIESIAGGMQP